MLSKLLFLLLGLSAIAASAAPKTKPVHWPEASGSFVVIAYQLRAGDAVNETQILERLRKPKKGDYFEVTEVRTLQAGTVLEHDGRRQVPAPKQVKTQTKKGGKEEVVGVSGETTPVGILYRAWVTDPAKRSIETTYQAILVVGESRLAGVVYPETRQIGVSGIGVATPIEFGARDAVVMPFPLIGDGLMNSGLIFFWKK